MTGPYTAQIFLKDVRELRSTDEGNRTAFRFYRSGGGATLDGTLRSAVFAIAALLDHGEVAYVRIIGREPSTGRTDTGRDAGVRRDESGRLITDLGSRYARERVFQGV
jgi:hypothetical protein